MECPSCDYDIENIELYEQFLRNLEEQIQKIPLKTQSKCGNCGSVETLPGYRWGRYCPCGYKLPQSFALASNFSAEDIVEAVLSRFASKVQGE